MDQWAFRLPDNETIMEMLMLMLTTNMANPIHDHVIKYCPMIFALLFVQFKAVFGSFIWFVHDSSFTIVNCRKCWTLSIRQSPRNMTSPHFLFLLNVGSIIAAPSVIRMSLKYIWFRVSSRNHMQCAAAGRLSQQLCLHCSARSSRTKARCCCKHRIYSFFSVAAIVMPAIYNRQKGNDCIPWEGN